MVNPSLYQSFLNEEFFNNSDNFCPNSQTDESDLSFYTHSPNEQSMEKNIDEDILTPIIPSPLFPPSIEIIDINIYSLKKQKTFDLYMYPFLKKTNSLSLSIIYNINSELESMNFEKCFPKLNLINLDTNSSESIICRNASKIVHGNGNTEIVFDKLRLELIKTPAKKFHENPNYAFEIVLEYMNQPVIYFITTLQFKIFSRQ